MWPWVVLLLAGLVLAVFWYGVGPPSDSETLIRIRSGELRVEKGRLEALAREHVSDIVREAGIAKGFIAITAGQRVVFSRSIPRRVHQRLRNVLLNQSA